MRLFIDADGCPAVNQAVRMAQRHGVPVTLVCDTAHLIAVEGAQTITVPKGRDAADFALLKRLHGGDLVVTQDYGLAALCLSKWAEVLHPDGRWLTADNIDGLLFARYVAQKTRRAGGRIRGPKRRTQLQDERFLQALSSRLAAEEED